jgi:hypothetical protein
MPFLTSLSVTRSGSGDGSAPSDASPPITVVPQFSPDIYDYYVLCTAGENALTVSMTASPGYESMLVQPNTSAEHPTQTLSLEVKENEAIVAAATDGKTTTEYWVRCLPDDFPGLVWTEHPEAGTPPAGYYLLGNQQVVNDAGYAIVLNGHGVPVWYYRQSTGVYDVDNVVDGAVSFCPYPEAMNSFQIHQLNPKGTTDVGSTVDPHELRVLENGDYLVLNSAPQSGVNLTGLTLPLADGGTQSFGPDSTISACNVHELNSAGTIVWKWVATDHFDAVKDSVWPQLDPKTTADGGAIVDTFHCNSIDVDPANGNLLVSSRHMDSVFYIDKMTGAVLWKMGGAQFSLDNATYVSLSSNDAFHRQHDARLQPGWAATCNGGEGEISVFDDETAEPANARGALYAVVVGSADGGTTGCDSGAIDGGANGTATLIWHYEGNTSSVFSGSFRISADGSHVIGWGDSNGRVLTELSPSGDDLLDIGSTDDVIGYRAVKVPLSAFSLDVLRKTAGQP